MLTPAAPGSTLPDDTLQDFDYGTDTVGAPCPFSAHTRHANSRGGPLVVTVGDKVNRRIMRRADAYCPRYNGADTDDGRSRGLAGHFIGVMFSTQFEFVMSQWVNSATFASNRDTGIDPLLGNVPDGSTFTYWESGAPVVVEGLSRFVTTKGGLYCFIPSITAIRWMAKMEGRRMRGGCRWCRRMLQCCTRRTCLVASRCEALHRVEVDEQRGDEIRTATHGN